LVGIRPGESLFATPDILISQQPTSSTLHGSERGWQPRSDHRMRKLKMPLFDGEDVYGWVYQAERFFEVHGLNTTGERLRAAVLSLEGPALSWFRWINNREPFRNWEELKRRPLHRFQSLQDGNLHEQFFSISQQGTARDYVTLFERMAAQLPGLSEEVLGGVFINGLKPELRTLVRTHQPANLSRAMDLTLIIDESRTCGATPEPTTNQIGLGGLQPQLAQPSEGIKEKQSGAGRTLFKRMTQSELKERRVKGMCFRCEEKFKPGHRCAPSTLKVMIVDDSDEEKEPYLQVKPWDLISYLNWESLFDLSNVNYSIFIVLLSLNRSGSYQTVERWLWRRDGEVDGGIVTPTVVAVAVGDDDGDVVWQWFRLWREMEWCGGGDVFDGASAVGDDLDGGSDDGGWPNVAGDSPEVGKAAGKFGEKCVRFMGARYSREGAVQNSFADVLKSGKVNPNIANDSSHAIVLDDSCLMECDSLCTLMGRIKYINALSNLYVILANEDFEKVKLSYLGGQWVLLDMDSTLSKEKIANHVGVGSWFEELKPTCNSFIGEDRIFILLLVKVSHRTSPRTNDANILSVKGENCCSREDMTRIFCKPHGCLFASLCSPLTDKIFTPFVLMDVRRLTFTNGEMQIERSIRQGRKTVF
nr:ankyrin repeat-containing protein [Tanacetum cinerariifolium]